MNGLLVVDQHALLQAFKDHSGVLLEPFDVAEALNRLTHHAVCVLGVDGAGVSLADEVGRLGFIAATDDRIATIEAQQDLAGEGPCHQAHQTGHHVLVRDLGDDHRWPAYRTAALAQGCRAVAGLPMPHIRQADQQPVGALNLYRNQAHDWDDDEVEVAQVLANMAAGAILNDNAMTESEELAAQLRTALRSRVVIEQAKGVLAGRRDITTSEAFHLLRSRARSTSTRIHDLAQQVVDGDSDLAERPG